MALQIRRGTEAQRGSLSGLNTPAVGEPLYTTDTKKLFIGDGSTTGGVALGYYSAINVAGQSSLSAANNTDTLTLVAGTNVVLTTDAGTDTITISAPRDVEVFNTGSINIFQNNIQGLNSNENIIIDPSGTGIVQINSGLTVTGTISGNLTGNVTGNVSGTAATVTNASQPNITSLGTLTGLTVNGTVTATTVVGNFDGQLNGSVFSDNSTLLVDAINNIHAGTFTTGEVTISDHTISTLNTNQDLVIDLAGTGRLDVQATIQGSRLEMFNDVFTGGIALSSAASTNASLVIATSHNSASTSTAFVTNPSTFSGPQIGATVTFLRSKGANPLAPQSVANNDEISTFDFNGFYLPDSAFYSAAKIRGVVDGAPSASAVPGRLEFVASNSSGSSAVRLTVSSTAVTATVPFKLPVVADDTARTALVATPAQGMMIFMQAGTSPAATNVAQVYNGTAWVNL